MISLPISKIRYSHSKQNPPKYLFAGFTLIELAVLITILGIIVAITAPSLTSSTNINLNAQMVAKQIQSDIRYAQKFGMNHIVWMLCSFETTGYQISYYDTDDPDPLNHAWVPIKNPLTNEDFIVTYASDFPGVEMTYTSLPSGGLLVFQYDGTPATLGHIELNNGPAVYLTPETGRVYVVP